MFAEIITIGDELLIGQVIDTNSAWIGKELNKIGIEVIRKIAVRDRKEEILEAVDNAMKRCDIILVTGGLGPTKDDITLGTLAEYFNSQLVFSEVTFENIQRLLSGRVPMNELNRNQAYVPEKAVIIQNRVGTAPITWFEENGKILVSMPGVPHEMSTVMSEQIIPRLQQKVGSDYILHRTYMVRNNPESVLAEKLENWETNLPESIKLAYLPNLGIIRLRLTARGKNQEELVELLNAESTKLKDILQDNLSDENNTSPEALVSNLLLAKKLTVSSAESCTGGRIAAQLTALAGSSAYFKGSIIAYDNEVKMSLLHVSSQTLAKHGAVSEETVIEMVKGAMKSLNTDCAVATSGIAGPSGGTAEKPVGTIWIAAGYKDKVITMKQEGDRGRTANMERAVNNALLLLYDVAK
ncbi:CinA family nicotinamide mononucleotide deamidase-related protein [Bacteroides sp. 519]|uniref:CinA family nicotinamide mononucleotide deamidase-related protein n=1 Tax=Bacteroides sp. 519 TaxID=2302937 RepID=UPI0013D170A9|nr:CinA family nicotinamide mononucleotide deamidase-related protein [Bacteroides sp. 519]NDV59957.1 CinA family nicotinamide mononucleotide deamidase-related protein [Bacteroides sp. 519]